MAPDDSRHTKQVDVWAVGGVLAFTLLVVFFVLQADYSGLLALDVKWLVVAAVPLIIALLKSDIIESFKGFGVELKVRLREPVGRISDPLTSAMMNLPGDEKRSDQYLRNLPRDTRRQIARLTFVQGRPGYYSPQVIALYVRQLPNLEFMEVVTEQRKFIALLPASGLRYIENDVEVNMGTVNRFVEALATKKVTSEFRDVVITKTISDDERLLTAVPLARNSRANTLVVVSQAGEFLGIVTVRMLEHKITNDVLALQKED
jgi:hypothetical protein